MKCLVICSFVVPILFVLFFSHLKWMLKIKKKIRPKSRNSISGKILNVKCFPRLSENTNMLLYFGWDVYCLRKQRDQVNACSFILSKCTVFILLPRTGTTLRIAEVHEILHSIVGVEMVLSAAVPLPAGCLFF